MPTFSPSSRKKGLYDPETAKRLRDAIYAKGDTEDPMKLFIDFMGRTPDPKRAFPPSGPDAGER
jgi:Zn-dependent oligopeptidase